MAAKAGSDAVVLRPCAGMRVLDLTHSLGACAGRLFADLGAEVILLEPPGGLPDRRPMDEGFRAPRRGY